MAQQNLLDYRGVSALTDIKPNVLRVYLSQARGRREQGIFDPSDFPEPDFQFGKSPVWLESTVRRWQGARPGKGNRA